MTKPAAPFLILVALLFTASARADPRATDRPDSPRIAALAESIRKGDGTALERFWNEMKGKSPLIEPLDPGHALVTFVWRGNDRTRRVFLIGGIPGGDETLDRLRDTDLWYLTEHIPAGARFGYMFLVDYPKMVPGGASRNPFPQADALNPSRLGFQSIVELAQAPPQPWIKPGPARGKLDAITVGSSILGKAPPVWVYTPSGYDPVGDPFSLLLALDGETNGAKTEESLIPIPTIVENLMAAKKIPRTLVVLVGSGDQESRNRNLRASDPFADYLAKELVPWLRSRYRAGTDPAKTVIAGQSYGGLAAAHAALRHPEVFGCVLSQSGSFWYNPSIRSGHAATYDTETGWLTRRYASAPRPHLRFYVEVGLFEQGAVHNSVLENRRFRDVLRGQGVCRDLFRIPRRPRLLLLARLVRRRPDRPPRPEPVKASGPPFSQVGPRKGLRGGRTRAPPRGRRPCAKKLAGALVSPEDIPSTAETGTQLEARIKNALRPRFRSRRLAEADWADQEGRGRFSDEAGAPWHWDRRRLGRRGGPEPHTQPG